MGLVLKLMASPEHRFLSSLKHLPEEDHLGQRPHFLGDQQRPGLPGKARSAFVRRNSSEGTWVLVKEWGEDKNHRRFMPALC